MKEICDGIRECPQEPGIVEQNGKQIRCSTCDGHGFRSVWSFGVKEPDECPDCGGSGRNWQYSRGAVARYYGGPLIGRERRHDG